MPERHMQALDARYRPLKDYVARKGGLRLSMHGGLRDQLVEMAVAEFPFAAPPDRAAEVLAARLRLRARERYGSVVGMILVSVIINLITKLVMEWWDSAHSHRVLMHGWSRAAKNPDVST